jgi:hypothetical protein
MNWRKTVLTALGLLAFVYVAASVDIVLRARSAYLEGEKWLDWDSNPAHKKAYYDAELSRQTKKIEHDRDSGKLSATEFDHKLMLAKFERDQALAESSVKYAYIWFQTAAELFTPPESRWTRMSREKMLVARQLWKKELEAKKIPYQDYMLE